MPASFQPLLSPPAFPANRYAALADRMKTLLGTDNDVVFVQAEAILALEAAATSLARPGLVALNIVTSPYGGFFGQWLRRGGAEVHEIAAREGQPIAVDAVEAALAGLPQIDLVAMVHAETSSGIVNPLKAIAGLGKARGSLLVVDAVASFGGHELEVDGLGIDICVTGPQKAMGGPAGLSIASVSRAAWEAMEKNPPPAPSNLSLLDIRRNWLETGRAVPPGMPSALEFWALEAALDGLEAEGLPERIERHRLAMRASRAGVAALGLCPWVGSETDASTLATAAPVPDGIDADALIGEAAQLGVGLTPGFGVVKGRLVRLDHAGVRAGFTSVMANVMAYGLGLQKLGRGVRLGAAAEAVGAVYAAAGEDARRPSR